MEMPKEFVEFFREQYPLRSRIRLREMENPDERLRPGAMGTLYNIENDGRFLVKWDTGLWQHIMPGHDAFSVLPQVTETLKLYMPLAAEVYIRDEYGDYPLEGKLATQQEILGYEDSVVARLYRLQLRDHSNRGLMDHYEESDPLNDKVRSVMITAETRNNQLWGVAVCQVTEAIDAHEVEQLKDFIKGQAMDGIGESLESREILVDGGRMHVMLWNEYDWDIKTEQERFPIKLAKGLPEVCFSVLKSTGELICIKKGEMGYYRSELSTKNVGENMRIANRHNEGMGVTWAQRQAMEAGSMFGWDLPGADPATYEQAVTQNQEDQSLTMGGM